LFLNDGAGTFRELPDAFHFAAPPQGSFTGMAAADYDGDGRLDLYLCCYGYFQNESQYGYPVPYDDAQNGPPNFLFRNQLAEDGGPAMSAAWFDYDLDGRPDLYVSNMWTAPGQRIVADPAFPGSRADDALYRGHTMGNALFHNLRGGKFAENAVQQGVSMGRW